MSIEVWRPNIQYGALTEHRAEQLADRLRELVVDLLDGEPIRGVVVKMFAEECQTNLLECLDGEIEQP
jgi:hypothetical protein